MAVKRPAKPSNAKAVQAKRGSTKNTRALGKQTSYKFRGESVGIKAGNMGSVIEIVREGLPYTAITTLGKESGISIESIANVVQIPMRTLARRKQAGRLAQSESERLLRLGMVFEKSLDLFEGDREAALRWLNAPAKAFAGETPLSMTQTEVGAREVEDLIGRLEHGVFS